MARRTKTERALIEGLSQSLEYLPGVTVRAPKRDSTRGDAREDGGSLSLVVDGQKLTLALEIKKAVYPRDVRQVLGPRTPASGQASGRVTLLVAESISPGAKELLQEERVGYWDSGGSLFLSAPGLYILIDRPAPKALKRTMRTLFSGRRAQTILALLSSPEEWVGVAEIARRSGASKPTVSQVMTELEQQGFVTSRGAGPAKERRVDSPSELLDTWVAELPALRKAPVRRFFVPGLKADRLARRTGEELEARGVSYGLTGQAAAQLYAPFLSSLSVVTLRVLPSPAVEEAIASLGGLEVEEGANLVVLESKAEDEFNFGQRADDVWLSSPIQTYLDLLQSTGRSRELADHLRRQTIGF